MAAVDLSVEELLGTAVSKLGEMLAPVGTFSILAPTDSRVKSTGTSGGVYQVEVTNAIPAAVDNVANYETGLTTGTQTNVTVTTANIPVLQTITNLQQQQGIPFQTRMEDAAKGLAQAVWDKCTAMMNGASYTDTDIGASGSLTVADLTAALTRIDSEDVTFLLKNAEASPIFPTDKNSFQLKESGAFGYNAIHRVSNFTGGVTTQIAFAAAKEAAVAVSGIALERSESINLSGSNALLENAFLESIGVPVEMRIWQNTATKDIHMTLETCFGISEVDSTAAEVLSTT